MKMYLGVFILVCITFGVVVTDEDIERGAIKCPSCVAYNKTLGDALSACDGRVKYENCSQDNPICEIVTDKVGDEVVVYRYCSDKESYEEYRDDCEEDDDCANGFCTESGCMATLPGIFQCPVCSASGENAMADCDNQIKYEICNRDKPICELVKKRAPVSGKLRVARLCSDKDDYDWLKRKCEKSGNCPEKGYCTESRCMARLSGIFQCPVCSASGENAMADCDNQIKYEICNRDKPICELVKKRAPFSGKLRVARLCSDKDDYDWLKRKCEKSGNCPEKGYCTESRCMARLSEN